MDDVLLEKDVSEPLHGCPCSTFSSQLFVSLTVLEIRFNVSLYITYLVLFVVEAVSSITNKISLSEFPRIVLLLRAIMTKSRV